MSKMSAIDYSTLFCIRFDFGLPLEDIFPPNDVHPKLHTLFRETEIAISRHHFNLLQIFGDFQGSLQEKLTLKDDLLKGKLRYRRDLNPGGFIWLIRHFLGLLPLPLFPKYTDGEGYDWEILASQCKLWGLRENYQLDSDIFWNINRLPKVNVMLIHYLIEFLRKICSKRDYSDKLDKRKVLATVKYFSSSLFLRPYVPGFVFPTGRLYYPLLYYLMQNWVRIKRQKRNLSLISEEILQLSSISEEFEDFDIKSRCSSTNEYTQFADICCQTSSRLLTEKPERKNNEPEENTEDAITLTKKTLVEQLDEISTTDVNKDQVQDDTEKLNKVEVSQEVPKSIASENTETKFEHLYDIPVTEAKCYSLNCSSETEIYEKDSESRLRKNPRQFIKKKLVKANKSLISVVSKFSEKIRVKQEISFIQGNCKYDLLTDSQPPKTSTPIKASSFTNFSPHIKYKKLLTL